MAVLVHALTGGAAELPPPCSDEQACQNDADGLKYRLNDRKAANRSVVRRKKPILFLLEEVIARQQLVVLCVEELKPSVDLTNIVPVAKYKSC